MFSPIAEAPYYAVIFSTRLSASNHGYEEMAEKMLKLASQQEGFLHVESVRDESGKGVTVSYWRDLESIANWKQCSEHLQAQQQGKTKWYEYYRLQICRVEREYGFEANLK
ncbi:MAG: antibiotic biosynthesis monooxygenase [Gammaproteobacteria bacterium]|nr:antibiotic biosynthesis monooxygenase [Gammaproteobacteria bacterium]